MFHGCPSITLYGDDFVCSTQQKMTMHVFQYPHDVDDLYLTCCTSFRCTNKLHLELREWDIHATTGVCLELYLNIAYAIYIKNLQFYNCFGKIVV